MAQQVHEIHQATPVFHLQMGLEVAQLEVAPPIDTGCVTLFGILFF